MLTNAVKAMEGASIPVLTVMGVSIVAATLGTTLEETKHPVKVSLRE